MIADALKSSAPEDVRVAISPDGNSFAISIKQRLYCFQANDGTVTQIDDVHTDIITAIQYSGDSKVQ